MTIFTGFQKRDLKNALVKKFMGSDLDDIQKDIRELLKANAQSIGISPHETMKVIFKGHEYYTHPIEGRLHNWIDLMALLPEYEKELEKLVEELKWCEEQRLAIDRYIAKMLTICNNMADVTRIIPPDIHRFEATLDNPTLSDAQIEKFYAENQKGLVILKEKVLGNFIRGKTK